MTLQELHAGPTFATRRKPLFMTFEFELVNQPEQLERVLRTLESHATVGLDTEADSMHHYYRKVCLLQVGVPGANWLVDPLAGLDIEPLLDMLAERELLLHGADYDLRMLYQSWGFRPGKVFDTMIAAQLLGAEQVGLAALVEEICDVKLSKHGQRADWSRRPLEEDLQRYAADDIVYLFEVAAEMRRRLADKGRLAWHEEACERLIEVTQVDPQPDPEAWRIKGGRYFQGRPAAVLREIWHWRDEIAEHHDIPPFKVAGNEFLLKWPRFVDEHPEVEYEDLPERPGWLNGPRLASFERALKRAMRMPKQQWPRQTEKRRGARRLSPREQDTLGRVGKQRDKVAAQLGLDPGVLCPKEFLTALTRDGLEGAGEHGDRPPLMDWQMDCLRPVLEPLLARRRRDVPCGGADDA